MGRIVKKILAMGLLFFFIIGGMRAQSTFRVMDFNVLMSDDQCLTKLCLLPISSKNITPTS